MLSSKSETVQPCGWCKGEGAMRDADGKLGEDCPRCRGASVLHSEWTAGTPTALCDDDKCAWKHRGVSLNATEEKSEAHVAETGHSVTIYWDQRKRVSARA